MKQIKKAFFIFAAVHVYTEKELEILKEEFPKSEATEVKLYIKGFNNIDLFLTENKKEAMKFDEQSSVRLIHSKAWAISSENWKRVRV